MNFGIVGYGNAGHKHEEAIKKLGHKVVAVCDDNIERIEQTPLYRFLSHKDMLDYGIIHNIDVVSICTPPATHKEIAIDCANAGKHIILEKPIALNVKDAREIIRVCDDKGVKLTVCHQLRFNPVLQQLKNEILTGKLGKIVHASATVRRKRDDKYYQGWLREFGGGSMLNQGLHAIDLLTWLVGDIEKVFTYSGTFIHDINTEDATMSAIRFKNGAIGTFQTTTCIKRKFLAEDNLFISGNKDSVSIDPMFKEGHELIIQNMIDSINNDMKPMITGGDGLKALEVAMAMNVSAYKAGEVYV